MILYLVGISCVGKSTVGKMLAESINFTFFDLDIEIQNYYNMPIERIQDECVSMFEYRDKASEVLDILFSKNIDAVIAGTPSGLLCSYLYVYEKHKADKDLYSIHINDSCENIVDRLIFLDKDSNPIVEILDEPKKKRYLKVLKDDYDFFKDSYKRADLKVNIHNTKLEDIPNLIIKKLQKQKVLVL